MATRPDVMTLTSTSVDILNAIRNSATQNYREYVPQATPDTESIREIGAVIMDYPSLQNEFLSALVNRIGRVLITSKMYENPWNMFKKGMLEYGESIEEIFVNLAKPYQFNPETSENNVFKRELPDVRAAFHIMNYQKFYKTTVQNDQLRQAFLGWQGITELISKIVDSLYTGANYDEFQTMKYLLAKHIIDGHMYPVTIPTVDTVNMKSIVSTVKGVSNSLEFMSDKYNLAGVKTHTSKSEQYILVNSKFDATMDVEVLASAFNMDKAKFMGQRVLVDSFGELDLDRLAELFAENENYVPLTKEQLTALDTIPAIIVDKSWFMIFDNFQNFTEQYNGEGLYWNYWYHVWKTFSVSPFANNALFVPGTPSVKTITVSPETAEVTAGQKLQLSATVETEYYAPQAVVWSVPEDSGAVISVSGVLSVDKEATGTITVTATSVFDNTVSATATITVKN